ncbi:BON domain-containing protein [Nitrospira sp. Nam74]
MSALTRISLLSLVFPLVFASVGLGQTAGAASGKGGTPQQTLSEAAQTVESDNTGRNVRDRDSRTLTPMDQSSDVADLEITQRIRKALMADDTLSTAAKNIKIITVSGTVTLRGPVETDHERVNILKKANTVANGRVNSQLEIISR